MPDDMDVADNEQNPSDVRPMSPESRAIDAHSVTPENIDSPVEASASATTGESAESTATDDAQFHEFCECVRSCTAASHFGQAWTFLEAENDLLRIDMSPTEFVAVINQEYSAETLVELNLFELVDGELQLPSWLEGDAPLYVAINEEKRTLQFSRDTEFLFPMLRVALDYAKERIPPESTQTVTTLYVLDSSDSVAIMRRLGLCAVVSEGLENLSDQDVHRLFDADQRTDRGWKYHLLLMGCDVARIDNRPSAAIREVITRLADAAEVYGIDPHQRFSVCQPSESDFHLLERSISFADTAQIAKVFEAWATVARGVRVSNWRMYLDNQVESYSMVRAALRRALQLPDVTRRLAVEAALPAYRAAARTAVIDKFHALFDSATDPFEMIDLIRATDIAETMLASDPLVRAAEAVLAGRSPPPIHEVHQASIEQLQRSLVELQRIRRDRKTKR